MKDKLSELIHRHKLPAFLVAVVILAGVLVVISVSVYYRSGAYQLDLSRPEYKDVRSQIEKDKKVIQRNYRMYREKPNLSQGEIRALKELLKNKHIAIQITCIF